MLLVCFRDKNFGRRFIMAEKFEKPISSSNRGTLDLLAQASELYKSYLEITSLVDFPPIDEEPEAPVHSWDFPLTLVINKTR